jgi:hypothetical protein
MYRLTDGIADLTHEFDQVVDSVIAFWPDLWCRSISGQTHREEPGFGRQSALDTFPSRRRGIGARQQKDGATVAFCPEIELKARHNEACVSRVLQPRSGVTAQAFEAVLRRKTHQIVATIARLMNPATTALA